MRQLVEPIDAGRRPAHAGCRAVARAPAIVSRKAPCRRRRSAGRSAPAGLVSGPRKLKIVRTLSSPRTGITYRVAWWWAGANMKPKPTSSMQRATVAGAEVDSSAERLQQVGRARQSGRRTVAVLGDRAARRGRDQGGRRRDVEGSPAAAGPGGIEQWVAMARRGTCAANARWVRARPASSSTVSPFIRSAIRNVADLHLRGVRRP